MAAFTFACPILHAATTEVVGDAADGDLEIAMGNAVAYASLTALDQPLTVRIAARRNDFEHGIIAEATPLAQTLLGAVVADEVVLRVPGRPTHTLVVLKVARPNANLPSDEPAQATV